MIDGTAGPLVDGRPYHDPEFLAALEEYHDRVAMAHEKKSQVGAPMPVLVPVAPGGALGNGQGDGRPTPSRPDGS